MEKIILYDFDDSFTLNIYSELLKTFKKSDILVVTKNNIAKDIERLLGSKEKLGLILGPGPGHPKEYPEVMSFLAQLMAKKNLYIVGICLGHQMIWGSLGAGIEASYSPVHGHAETIILNKKFAHLFQGQRELVVQRYNSLCVRIDQELIPSGHFAFYSEDDEVVIGYADRFISYQFHPESVGTSCPELFFRSLEKFLL